MRAQGVAGIAAGCVPSSEITLDQDVGGPSQIGVTRYSVTRAHALSFTRRRLSSLAGSAKTLISELRPLAASEQDV